MSTPAKKFKSKFFRVATEGATTDGRHIDRAWIQQMAESYNPQKYGARVWLEHIRGIYPDSDFKAYGDVIAVEAREVEDNKLALFAQIEPTPEMVELNKKRQKIYTSIEINQKFADTGRAYLVGLAVTDSPASLGTEVLAFAQQNPAASPFSTRKQAADNLFSAAAETTFEFDEVEEEGAGIAARVRDMLASFTSRSDKNNDKRFSDIGDALEAITGHIVTLEKRFADLVKSHADTASLQGDLKTLSDEFRVFCQRIDQTENRDPTRPPATGGNGVVLTDI